MIKQAFYGVARHLPAFPSERFAASHGILRPVPNNDVPQAMQRTPARFNVTQAAAYLEVDRDTIRRWRHEERLPNRGTWTRAELDAAYEAKPVKAKNGTRKKTGGETGRSGAREAGSNPAASNIEAKGEGPASTTPAHARGAVRSPGHEVSDASEAAAGRDADGEPGELTSETKRPPSKARDPLRLNLPKPDPKPLPRSGEGVDPAPPGSDEAQADDSRAGAETPSPPPPEPTPPATRKRTLFDNFFKKAS